MFRRELCQALPQNDTRILLLHRDFWIITGILDRLRGLVVQFLVRSLSQGREGLVSGDRQQPRRNLRPCFETVGLAPDVEEHLTDQVFCPAWLAYETEDEPVNAHMVPSEQNLHRELVTACDTSDQRFVCGR